MPSCASGAERGCHRKARAAGISPGDTLARAGLSWGTEQRFVPRRLNVASLVPPPLMLTPGSHPQRILLVL